MSDIDPSAPPSVSGDELPPLPEPWKPAPATAGGRRRGCGVPALAGCGCLLVGLLLLTLVPMVFGDRVLAAMRGLLERTLDPIEQAILDNLPEDADPELVARLQRAVDRLPAALSEGQQDFLGPFHVVNQLTAAAQKAQQGSLTNAELESLVRSLEAVTGAPAESEPDAAPPQEPEDAPQGGGPRALEV